MTRHIANQSLADARPYPVWQESRTPATVAPRLTGEVSCDIAIVGGGFAGLWTALMAHQRWPEATIVVLEAGQCGGEASGRNGGFCALSISHGVSNALKRWPKEAEQLVRLGRENLVAVEKDLQRFGMDVAFERSGKLNVASQHWQVGGLRAMQRNYERFGIVCEFLDGEALMSRLDSPAYVAGVFEPNYALLNPVKMVAELRRVCLAQGVQMFEHSPVTALHQDRKHQVLEAGLGSVKAVKVALGTNIAPPLLGEDIGGEWIVPVQRGVFETVDPSDESVLAQVAAATADDIDLAVAAARKVFDEGAWPRWKGAQRAHVLRRIADGIRPRQDELAAIEVRDNGKPLPEALWGIADTAGCFDFYAGLAEGSDQHSEQSIGLTDERFSSSVIKEPVGVVAAIIPWNFPMLMASWKVAPALAAGCTVVLKPSELTPLTALELAGIADQAGLPAGVLNVVTGLGHEAGALLAEHPDVDKIAFTGSVPTGRKIMQAAAAEIKNISLELGGKSPFVIFADSDLDAAVEWILFGIFWNQGQVCSATSRVLVERALYPALLERLIAATEQIQIGQGFTEGVKLGPLVSQGQLEKVLGAIAAGQQEGARLVSGGTRPAHLQKGYYLTPAIFADVPEQSSVWREEIFDPVVCLRAFDTEAEAIRLANDSPFGLAAAVMSRDIPRCERVTRRFRAGIIWVNCSQPTFVEAPWGGYKQSGIGRELGEWGYNNYLETKQITRYNGGALGWYLS